MKTAKTNIDVYNGTLTMEFDGEVICFNIFEAMRYPSDLNSCFSVNIIDSLAQEFFECINPLLGQDLIGNYLIPLFKEGLVTNHSLEELRALTL